MGLNQHEKDWNVWALVRTEESFDFDSTAAVSRVTESVAEEALIDLCHRRLLLLHASIDTIKAVLPHVPSNRVRKNLAAEFQLTPRGYRSKLIRTKDRTKSEDHGIMIKASVVMGALRCAGYFPDAQAMTGGQRALFTLDIFALCIRSGLENMGNNLTVLTIDSFVDLLRDSSEWTIEICRDCGAVVMTRNELRKPKNKDCVMCFNLKLDDSFNALQMSIDFNRRLESAIS